MGCKKLLGAKATDAAPNPERCSLLSYFVILAKPPRERRGDPPLEGGPSRVSGKSPCFVISSAFSASRAPSLWQKEGRKAAEAGCECARARANTAGGVLFLGHFPRKSGAIRLSPGRASWRAGGVAGVSGPPRREGGGGGRSPGDDTGPRPPPWVSSWTASTETWTPI